MKTRKGTGGVKAESLFHRWLLSVGWRNVERARASINVRAGRHIVQRNDIFGAFDFLCADLGRYPWLVQVTTEAGVAKRKLKIAKLGPLPMGWRVSIVTHHLRGTSSAWLIRDRTENGWARPYPLPFCRSEVEKVRLRPRDPDSSAASAAEAS